MTPTPVYETRAAGARRPSRKTSPPGTAIARDSGARSAAGAPIERGRPPLGRHHRRVEPRRGSSRQDRASSSPAFTELVATAIANTQARRSSQLSRARLVAAADETRRRIVRDLHDGAQNRLGQTIMTLNLAQRCPRQRRWRDGAGAVRPGARATPSKPTSSCAILRRASFRASSLEVVWPQASRSGRAVAANRQHRRNPRSVPPGNRGQRLLRRRRSADQPGQALSRSKRDGHRMGRGQSAARGRKRRWRRRRLTRGRRSARPRRSCRRRRGQHEDR